MKKMSGRDKLLALVLPAIVLFIGYATYGLSVWREKHGAAEKGIASTRAKLLSATDEAVRRDKLALANREIQSETKALQSLRTQPAAAAAELEREKQELRDTKQKLTGAEHKLVLSQAEARHKTALTRTEAEHKTALAKLWLPAGGLGADRTHRIELLNKVLVRYDLTIVNGTDDVLEATFPPRLKTVAKAASEVEGIAPPKVRQLRIRGKYADVAAAMESIARGDAWAVPLGLSMKPLDDDSGELEWTITVWI